MFAKTHTAETLIKMNLLRILIVRITIAPKKNAYIISNVFFVGKKNLIWSVLLMELFMRDASSKDNAM